MPRQVKAEFNTFVKGLITEASPLNFPDNASLEEQNFVLDSNGTRRRRKGMDFGPGDGTRPSASSVTDLIARNPNTFQWLSPNGIEDLVLLVVQLNNHLYFFDQSASPLNVTGYLADMTISMPPNTVYSFDTVDGYLAIAAGEKHIAIVEFAAPSTFTISYNRLLTRDLWGVEAVGSAYETDITYRDAGPLGDAQKYNLQNQSWGIPRKDSGGTLQDPTAMYQTALGVYPSNSEVVWTGLQFTPAGDDPPFERLYPNLFEETFGANIKAPRGYFIIDLLDRGITREANFAENKTKHPSLSYTSVALPEDSTPKGATVVTGFAGRMFYGGFSGEVVEKDARSPNLNSYIFFSQLIRSKLDFFKCYQEGDPSSRENSDLVDTDGGFIRVSGMNKLVGMMDLGSSLIAIADNGVWQITGGSDYGFSPVNLKVSRISPFGCVSGQSIVEVNGKGMFWGNDGIYGIIKDQFGDFSVVSLSENTIQTLYDTIPTTSKVRCTGAYNGYTKKVHWLYKIDPVFSQDSFTYEIVFDTSLQAFSRNRIYQTTADMPASQVVEVFTVVPPIVTSTEIEVLQENIYLAVIGSIPTDIAHFGFSYYCAPAFLDWESTTFGRDAFAYLVTGAASGGDSSTRKFLPYVTTHMLRTESGVDPLTLEPLSPSGCLMRVRWDWSDSIASRKWSPQQEIYRYRFPLFVEGPSDPYDNGFVIVTSRSKVRGSGKAFSIEFRSEEGKDCVLLGWNILAQSNDV
jgi:hypothetical protein